MRHNQMIMLISISVTEDAIGNQILVTSERQVYANEFYVSGSEFYNAAVAGIKPEKQFEIYSHEYQDEPKLKHKDATYKIVRTEKRGDKVRITCEKVIGEYEGVRLVDHKLVQDLKALVETILADADVTMDADVKEAYQTALDAAFVGW